ncbi:hypothetical protein [Algivirga pacifica]|uniref:H repeat-associated protein N-terminal domain-containing protein n=1 Tax=Algivirga pacifica TaxID=1162670 RepID=A0ABP9DL30_9BACT
MIQVTPKNAEAFYAKLQERLPDTRDNRGKQHELAFVIILFIVALLRHQSRYSMLSIYRNMQRFYRTVSRRLNYTQSDKCVSRSQLIRILIDLDYEVFNTILSDHIEESIGDPSIEWMAIDGKELRGSIDSLLGQNRGESTDYWT